jgi:hypothetical protein
VRKCAFCPSPATVTGEHLISDWTNKLLQVRTHRYRIYQRSHGTKPSEWDTATLNLKANVACKTCNSGWMSDLENNEARPIQKDIILHDAPVDILPLGAASIAAFTMKCGFVADCLTRHREPFFNAHTRHEFAKTLRPPDGVHMWIGRVQQEKGKRHGIYKTRYGRPHSPTVVFDAYVFTFSIETLILQLAAIRFFDSFGFSAVSREITQEGRFDDIAIPFWPPHRFNQYVFVAAPWQYPKRAFGGVRGQVQGLEPYVIYRAFPLIIRT